MQRGLAVYDTELIILAKSFSLQPNAYP